MERRELTVETREKTGKGAARKMRKNGRIPGVLYGPKIPSVSLSLDPDLLNKAIDTQSGLNTLLDLKCESSEVGQKTVMLKEYQAHPLTEEFIHVDLIEVDLNSPLRVSVPITLQGTPEGVTLGGGLEHLLREIELSSLPAQIPDEVVVDVGSLQIGQTVHVFDIQFGEGIELITSKEDAVATVTAPKLAEEVAEEPEEGEEGEEGEEAAAEGDAEKKDEGDAPDQGTDKKTDKKKG